MAPRAPKDTEKKPTKAPKAVTPAKAKAPVVEVKTEAAPPAPAAKADSLKLKDLVDRVASKTGGKKPDVKATVEATLAAIGEALATGTALTIPPLGKLRVVKNKGPALTLKLRLADGAKAAGLALADDGEDS